MLWVGLTGGIASGKSTATQILREQGFTVVDADQLAKDVVVLESPGLASIRKIFGENVLLPDGSLDRKKISKLVFENPNELRKLEGIIHPLVQQKVLEARQNAEHAGEKIAFYDVPLLFEKSMQDNFDFVVLISCSEQTQKTRLRSRSGLSENEIEARLRNQTPLGTKETQSDFVVRNETTIEDLRKKLRVITAQLLQKA